MKRFLVAVLAAGALASLASCGQKSADTSSSAPSAGGSSTPAAGSPTVAAVSQYDSGPRAGESPVNEALVAQGQELFKNKGCSACHAFGRKLTCPDLQGVTMRRTAAWMENQILHPDVMTKTDPIAHGLFAQFALQMPNQGLTPDQARAVIEFFKHSDHEAGLTKAGSH